MTRPIVQPDRVGFPCWEKERADQMLQAVARVDVSDAANFLACHSPVVGITQGNTLTNETEVFDWLLNRSSPETLVVVTGEQGSGKSHFINWMKLRLDDALSRGEYRDIQSVMIKRRSGSLKDALEQLVEQLPNFQAYLDPIQAAIAKLSKTTARRELCFAMSSLIHQQPLQHRRLKNLHDFFSDPGSLQWLCRDGGTVDRNIQRLISTSNVEEREALPRFSTEDFVIEAADLRRQVGANVQELIEYFDDTQFCSMAVEHANKFIRAAVEKLTGLGNQSLHQIFRSIRKDLKKQGHALALFIEDVSTLSALDIEVVNILEPQNDPSLCQLLGVLGMTNQAVKLLPHNMQDRVDRTVNIPGSDDSGAIQTDPDHVDRFVARYLNALRSDSREIIRIAEHRRQGEDVRISACDDCTIKDDCFNAFGKTTFGEVEVGLFPFRPGAAFRLLQGLIEEASVRRNSRGLIKHIMTPVMTTFTRGIDRAPISMGLQVQPRRPTDFDSASPEYLGGWDDKSQQRLTYLVWYWSGVDNLLRGIGDVALYREAMRLPAFSQVVKQQARAVFPAQIAVAAKDPEKEKPVTRSSAESERYLRILDKWSGNNERLAQDSSFRDLLLPLIKYGINWEDLRQPAEPARTRALSLGKRPIGIEDMISRLQGFQFPELKRDESTAKLLRARLRFHYQGSQSWAYPEVLPDRRVVGDWLRTHSSAFVKAVDPIDLDPSETYRAGIRFLIVAYQFSQRKPLPGDYSEAVSELFSFPPNIPTTLSTSLKGLAEDLPHRVSRVREFLWSELNVPQGAGGVVMIDPLPIIRAIEDYSDDCTLNSVDVRFGQGHWETRFSAVSDLNTGSWARIEEALIEEGDLLASAYESVVLELGSWELDAQSAPDQLDEFWKGCKEVKTALARAEQPTASPSIDALFSRNDNPVAKWKRALMEAETVTITKRAVDVLRFRAEDILDLQKSLSLLVSWVKGWTKVIDERYSSAMEGADLDGEIANAQVALDAISTIAGSRKGAIDV